MKKLQEFFSVKNRRVLNVYCTAGFPEADSIIEVIKALEASGADIIELGIPYSDPLADGPVIQYSNAKALKNGMTITKLFEQLSIWKDEIKVPVILMGYLNPILQYGFDNFCKDAAASGVAGLIIPDIPPFEFEKDYQSIIKLYGLDFIFLVTPETEEVRVKKLDELSSGFLYAVSSSSITGSNQKFDGVISYLKRLQEMQLKNSVLVGFGIKDKESFNLVCEYANGGIIGSAYIQTIDGSKNIKLDTKKFIDAILNGAANGT